MKPKYKVGDKVVFYRNTKIWDGDSKRMPLVKGQTYTIVEVGNFKVYKDGVERIQIGYGLKCVHGYLNRWVVPASCIKPA